MKFTTKKCYAHDFLRGHLFCNTVDYRKLERSGQGDKYEGLVGWFQPSLGTLTIEGCDATAELPGPVGISRKEIRFHHLFCMYGGHIVGIPPTASDEQVEARMQLSVGPEEFGEHAVLVSNVTEFISRAERALNRDGHAFRHDLVGYYDPVTFHGEFTDEEAVFRKQLQRFGHQREYRFDIDNGEMEDVPLIVEVGDLSDIAELYSWNELNDLLGTIEVERRRAGEEAR